MHKCIPLCVESKIDIWYFFLQAPPLIEVASLVKLVRVTPRRMPVSTAGVLGLQALYVSGSHLDSSPHIFPEGHSSTEPSPQRPYMLIVLRPTLELLIHDSS